MRSENIAGINEFFITLKNIWLERSSLYEEQNFDQALSNKKSSAKQNNNIISQPIISQLASSSLDIQKMFQDELAKRDAKYEAEIAK
jgi:hypothetical protein